MPGSRLRVSFDANVLVAGIQHPRWPHEVLRTALLDTFDLVLPQQVIDEAVKHLPEQQQTVLAWFLSEWQPVILPVPGADLVAANPNLVRSAKDIPIALALLAAGVHIFVTNDRDFTDPGATLEPFTSSVRVMLPAVFLRDIIGWSSEELEAIRHRTWGDMPPSVSPT